MTRATDASERFVMFPERFMARTDLSDGAKILWIYLRQREVFFGVGNVFESRKTIASAIGTDASGYKRRAAELVALGLLRIDVNAGLNGRNIYRPIAPLEARTEGEPGGTESEPGRTENSPQPGPKTVRDPDRKRSTNKKKNQKDEHTFVAAVAPIEPSQVRAALERGFKRQTGTGIPRTIPVSEGQLTKLATQAAARPGGNPVAALEALGAELGKQRGTIDPWRLLLSTSGGFGLMPVDAVPVAASTPEIAKLEARVRLIDDLCAAGIENPDEEKRLTDERLSLLGQIKQLRTRATEAA